MSSLSSLSHLSPPLAISLYYQHSLALLSLPSLYLSVSLSIYFPPALSLSLRRSRLQEWIRRKRPNKIFNPLLLIKWLNTEVCGPAISLMVRRKRDSVRGGNWERHRGRVGEKEREREKVRRGLNLPQVVPLSPAKGESDYELKRSFALVAFSTASLVGELRLSRIWIHKKAFLHRKGERKLLLNAEWACKDEQ